MEMSDFSRSIMPPDGFVKLFSSSLGRHKHCGFQFASKIVVIGINRAGKMETEMGYFLYASFRSEFSSIAGRVGICCIAQISVYSV